MIPPSFFPLPDRFSSRYYRMPAHPNETAPELDALDTELKPLISSPEKEPPAINKHLSDLYDKWVDKKVKILDKGKHHNKTGVVRGVDSRAMIHIGKTGVDGDWLHIRLDAFNPTAPIGDMDNVAYAYATVDKVELQS